MRIGAPGGAGSVGEACDGGVLEEAEVGRDMIQLTGSCGKVARHTFLKITPGVLTFMIVCHPFRTCLVCTHERCVRLCSMRYVGVSLGVLRLVRGIELFEQA